MQRRHDPQNIPIELLRSFIVIQECGSFTKAAELLSLTQPAISAQIKRLQQLVGGDVFVRSGFGVSLSEKGEIVNRYARRILAMNDQILALSGSPSQARSVRIGLPNIYAANMISVLVSEFKKVAHGERLQILSQSSSELARSLASGYLDIAVIAMNASASGECVARWSEPMAWVCGNDLATSPGAPIPIQSWPHGITDQLAIEALESAGLAYSVVFTATDLCAHLAASKAGLGYLVMPVRFVPSDLKVARESFLPDLPDCQTGIYVNRERDSDKLRAVAACVAEVLRPPAGAERPRTVPGMSGARDGRLR